MCLDLLLLAQRQSESDFRSCLFIAFSIVFYCHIVLCILTNDLDAGGWCLRNNTKIVVVEGGKSFLILIKNIFEDPLFLSIFFREYLPLDTRLIKCAKK